MGKKRNKKSESQTTASDQKIKPLELYNLVIGLSGPYGSGCSSLADELVKIINDWPGCKAIRIQVSDLIKLWHGILIGPLTHAKVTDEARRGDLQKAGTALRKLDSEIIGKIIANQAYKIAQDYEKNNELKNTKTLVFIIDSLKNTSDLKSLQKIYKDEFFFAFMNANTDFRWRRMRDYKSWKEKDKVRFQELDNIDSDEKEHCPEVGSSGQQVKKLANHADYYFVNNATREDLQQHAYRMICLLFGLGINQPFKDEKCMHLAFSSANQSACLSRQVGAAIFTKEGNILAIGHNDVPKASGGLYSIEDNNEDHRCLNVGDRRCINDTNKEERFNNLISDINTNSFNHFRKNLTKGSFKKIRKLFKNKSPDSFQALIASLVKASEFKDATEYCRAVHAEMDALLSVCRNLSGSTIDASVYVTTQPCHNCVKHLICAGVGKIVYIEPYPKSLGEELHSDAITLNPRSEETLEKSISFFPYQGVAPRRYHDIFDMDEKRKEDDGKMCYKSKEEKASLPKFSKKVEKRSRPEKGRSKDLITINELVAMVSITTLGKKKNGEIESDETEQPKSKK